jgi:4-amino-4-deoxy-L-arabinose transferase-like glycosyltransferase
MPPVSPASDRAAAWSRCGRVAGVTALLALYWWLAVSAQVGKGVAYDETAHLTAGYSYWRFDDYRFHTENGNLPQRWAGLALLAADPQPRLEPADDPVLWQNSHIWGVSQGFFFRSGNNTDYLLFSARAAMAFWGAATGLLVFLWSRRLWGPAAGWFSLGLLVVSPTMLAHGALVTSDMCAAFWLLAATGALWRMTERLTPGRVLLAAAATGLAAVAKFSAVLLPPIFGVMVAWRCLAPEPVELALRAGRSRRRLGSFGAKLGAFTGAGAAVALGTWVIIWTSFGWRFSGFAPGLPEGWKYYIPWPELLSMAGIWRTPLVALLQGQVLPEAFIEGFAHLNYQGMGRSAFLLGHYSNTGWWWFFPYAFLAKSTLAELLAVALAAIVGLRQLLRSGRELGRAWCAPVFPLLALVVVYGAFAVLSPLNIGHRHILPLYPPLFILTGGLLAVPALGWLRRFAVPALLLLGVGESVAARPHYLAFFNQAAGGPENGWRQLVDSSLDWGQDLPALADWLRANRRPGEIVYTSYFGNGDLAYEGIQARELAGVYAYDKSLRWYELEPGLYAISATMLQTVYNPWRGPWTVEREGLYRGLRGLLAQVVPPGATAEERAKRNEQLKTLDELRFARLAFYLRARRPEASLGHSIFVFRLSREELKVVTEGTLTELADAIDRAAAAK